MRKIIRPSQKTPYAQQETAPLPIPAPVGGWNAIDPLANMDPKYAPILNNWVPRTSWIELRAGYNAWVQGLGGGGAVETLMTYKPVNGIQFMFAAAGGNFYDISNQGLPVVVRSGFGNNRWQYLNFAVPGGSNYLYAVNGSDNPQLWDGTSWTSPNITGGPAQTTFFNIHSHQQRLWFIPNNATKIYYLAASAITGAVAGSLDLGPFMTEGGSIVAMGTWTYNGGTGPQNLAVFITSRGQTIIYSGTDPTNSSTWTLVGVFNLPPPLGVRCFTQIGSDLGVITLQGVLPLSQVVQLDTGAVRVAAITGRIQNAMLQSAQQYQNNFGWQLISYPAQALLFLNVPQQTNTSQVQYVQNFLNGAWTQFQGWNANCFELFNDLLYFGGNIGDVNIAYQGPADLVSAIVADMQCAFNFFGAPGRSKRMSMIQPLMITGGTITPTLGVDIDFGTSSLTAPVSSFTLTGAVYDQSVYDNAFYAQGPLPQSTWQSVNAEGHALAVRMKVNVSPIGPNAQSVFDTGVFDTMVFDGFTGQSASILQINAFNAVVEMGNFI
jgi:hypothetical protein